MSTAPYSIFDALSKLPFSPAPATDLVHYLIRSLAQEACEQHEVFGIQTYYRIVSRARDICHRINEYIVDVAVDHKDWEKYHKYTAQIAPLESLLFQVSQLIHEETHRKHEHRENALQLYIERFEHWKCHREIYRNILIKLHSAPFDACDYDWELDFKAACDHDDRAWLSIICEKILISLNIFAEKFQRHIMRFSHITAVIKLLAEIQIILEESETFDETRIICVTRCFMTIWGMIQVACDPHIDWAVSRHLRSRKTWTRILEWVERFKIAVCDFSVEIEILVEELTIIVEYVVHAHTEPQDVDELLQFLICHPAKVRRPYYAQSLALVRLCENIGGHIKTTHHGADIGKLEWYEYNWFSNDLIPLDLTFDG
ncbi:hypothetical protein FRC03_006030 [Tulasnella sp. 419]|nr:hypothetical protein FRC03_006030 [Tulasnella sp. 419]